MGFLQTLKSNAKKVFLQVRRKMESGLEKGTSKFKLVLFNRKEN